MKLDKIGKAIHWMKDSSEASIGADIGTVMKINFVGGESKN